MRGGPCEASADAAAQMLELAALGPWFSVCPRPAAAASPRAFYKCKDRVDTEVRSYKVIWGVGVEME